MNEYTIITPVGTYTQIAAWSEAAAKNKVYRLTLGRVPVERMHAFRTK